MSLTPTNEYNEGDNGFREEKTHEKEENLLNHLQYLKKILVQSDSVAYIRNGEPHWEVSFISPNVSRLGYQPEEFYQKNITFLNLIHPDDLVRLQTEIALNAGIFKKNMNLELIT